jgi:hypothetical protein
VDSNKQKHHDTQISPEHHEDCDQFKRFTETADYSGNTGKYICVDGKFTALPCSLVKKRPMSILQGGGPACNEKQYRLQNKPDFK